jgi:hypothetical protein
MPAALPVLGMVLAAAGENRVALPADAKDLSFVSAIELRDGSGQVVASGTFGEAKEGAGREREREAVLSGTGGATGEAEVETRTAEGQTMQELEIEVKGVASGAALTIWVDGERIGSLIAGSGGEAEIELFGPVGR